jgi:hypothetical protein
MVKRLEAEIKFPEIVGFLARHRIALRNESHGDVAHSMGWTRGVKKLSDEDHRVRARFGMQTLPDLYRSCRAEGDALRIPSGAGDCTLSNTSEAISGVAAQNNGNSRTAKLAPAMSADNASSPKQPWFDKFT